MPAPIAPLRIAAYTVTSAAGVGRAALHGALLHGPGARPALLAVAAVIVVLGRVVVDQVTERRPPG